MKGVKIPMENKNKISISLPVFITIIVVGAVIILGLIFCLIFTNFINKTDKTDNNDRPYIESVVNPSVSDKEDSKKPSTDSKDENTTVEDTKTEETKPENTTVEPTTTPDDSTSSTIVGKASTQANPLKIGEWGIASKYNSGDYVDVPVKVTNVTRGNEAVTKIKAYCDKSSVYKYTEPKEGMEWAVIDYTVDLTNVEGYSFGKSMRVTSKIKGTGDNSSIRYNGKTYILTTMDMSETYSKENIANGSFAVSLPIGCTEYTIAMGEYNKTNAFFAGK